MHRTSAVVATAAMAASVTLAVQPASADETRASTVNTVGYVAPDGSRGTVNLNDGGSPAVVPGAESPLVVSLGDSYISGEAGRWAGNVIALGNYGRADALGPDAYNDVPNAEAIDGCHRARQAEVNFQAPGATSVNLACSGATTRSALGSYWKPGIDFAAQPLSNGATGLGQAQMLKNLASANPGRVRMVMLSIGGNDFDFGKIVGNCVTSFIKGKVPCSKDPATTDKVAEKNMQTQLTNISAAIDRVIQAVGDNHGKPWTLVVQDYPSPVATRDTIRYGQNVFRWQLGGCPMYDKDLDWANSVALQNIDATVRSAVEQQRKAHPKQKIEFLELKDALKGHRLCEQNTYALDEPGTPVRSWKGDGAVNNAEWVQSIRALGQVTTDLMIWPFKTQESLHPNYWAQLAYQSCLSQAYGDGSTISGGACTYKGPGLDAKGRPRMALLTTPGDMELNKPGAVRSATAKKAGPRQVKVSWKAPRNATKVTRYEYRVKVGQKKWSGWLAAGAAKAVIVATVEKPDYRVQVTAVNGARRSNPTKSLVFTGRGVPFEVL